MIIGDKEHFAVEFDLDEDPKGEWLLGKFCYWVCGNRFGKYESGTTLRNIFFDLERITSSSGKRNSKSLFSQNAQEVYFNFLNSTIQDEKHHPMYELSKREGWQNFDITPDSVAEFDGFLVLLLDGGGMSKVVAYDYDRGIFECHIQQGVVDQVLIQAHSFLCKWIKEQ